MKKLLLVAGARPNFMKLAPLYASLKAEPDAFQPIVVHTGQHYDRQMSDVFFEQLALPEPDINLGIGSATHGAQTGRILEKLEKVMLDSEPDMVVVFGDVNSTLAGALAAVKLGIPVAHVEAGLRSNDWSMPEEINRVVADRVSALLFTTCEDAADNLLREGATPDSIHFVGNVMIDSLVKLLPVADKLDVLRQYDLQSKRYTLVTMHRASNVDDEENLRKLTEMLSRLAVFAPVMFPVHPRTMRNLKDLTSAIDRDSILDHPNIRLSEPLGYLEFLKLEKEAALVVTDSGGVQEESTYLQVPCLTARPNTERPVTITDGTNTLVGLDPLRVAELAEQYLFGGSPQRKRPRLWDGKAAPRIVSVMQRFFEITSVPAPGVTTDDCVEQELR
jgi:UDP-N-acetylglucosamine 2-epimerase (non-hydrolysing)